MKSVISALADLVAVIPGAKYVTVSVHVGRPSIGIQCESDEATCALAGLLGLVQPKTVSGNGKSWLSTESYGSIGPSINLYGPQLPITPAIDPASVGDAVAKARQAIAIVRDAEVKS